MVNDVQQISLRFCFFLGRMFGTSPVRRADGVTPVFVLGDFCWHSIKSALRRSNCQGKIRAGIFAEQFTGFGVIRTRSGVFVIEAPDVNAITILLDLCPPAFVLPMPRNSAILRGRALFLAPEGKNILLMSANLQIRLPPIIKTVTVFMVDFQIRRTISNYAVHKNTRLLAANRWRIPNSIKTAAYF